MNTGFARKPDPASRFGEILYELLRICSFEGTIHLESYQSRKMRIPRTSRRSHVIAGRNVRRFGEANTGHFNLSDFEIDSRRNSVDGEGP